MSENKGKLIVLDGLDGCGKSTQWELLQQDLQGRDDVVYLSYPCYDSDAGKQIKRYLSGELQLTNEQKEKLYAADRYIDYLANWRAAYEAGKLIIAARYTTSMMIYSLGSCPTDVARVEAAQRIMYYEYDSLGLPTPDAVIYLSVEQAVFMDNLKKRTTADGTQLDVHESNTMYMRDCYRSANLLSAQNNWHVITCTEQGTMRSREDIHKDIMKVVNEVGG